MSERRRLATYDDDNLRISIGGKGGRPSAPVLQRRFVINHVPHGDRQAKQQAVAAIMVTQVDLLHLRVCQNAISWDEVEDSRLYRARLASIAKSPQNHTALRQRRHSACWQGVTWYGMTSPSLVVRERQRYK